MIEITYVDGVQKVHIDEVEVTENIENINFDTFGSEKPLMTIEASKSFFVEFDGLAQVVPSPAMQANSIVATLQALDWDKVLAEYMGAGGMGSALMPAEAAMAEAMKQVREM